jgi:hypothetical protein
MPRRLSTPLVRPDPPRQLRALPRRRKSAGPILNASTKTSPVKTTRPKAPEKLSKPTATISPVPQEKPLTSGEMAREMKCVVHPTWKEETGTRIPKFIVTDRSEPQFHSAMTFIKDCKEKYIMRLGPVSTFHPVITANVHLGKGLSPTFNANRS